MFHSYNHFCTNVDLCLIEKSKLLLITFSPIAIVVFFFFFFFSRRELIIRGRGGGGGEDKGLYSSILGCAENIGWHFD